MRPEYFIDKWSLAMIQQHLNSLTTYVQIAIDKKTGLKKKILHIRKSFAI